MSRILPMRVASMAVAEAEVAKLADAFQEAASRVADMHAGGDSKAAGNKKSSNW